MLFYFIVTRLEWYRVSSLLSISTKGPTMQIPILFDFWYLFLVQFQLFKFACLRMASGIFLYIQFNSEDIFAKALHVIENRNEFHNTTSYFCIIIVFISKVSLNQHPAQYKGVTLVQCQRDHYLHFNNVYLFKFVLTGKTMVNPRKRTPTNTETSHPLSSAQCIERPVPHSILVYHWVLTYTQQTTINTFPLPMRWLVYFTQCFEYNFLHQHQLTVCGLLKLLLCINKLRETEQNQLDQLGICIGR